MNPEDERIARLEGAIGVLGGKIDTVLSSVHAIEVRMAVHEVLPRHPGTEEEFREVRQELNALRARTDKNSSFILRASAIVSFLLIAATLLTPILFRLWG